RIGVVEPEVAATAELPRDPEVEADRLGMADVQIAVGLGREARDGRADPSGIDVCRDDLAEEVSTLGGLGGWPFDGHGLRLLQTAGGGVATHRGRTTLLGSWLARQDSNLEPPDPESGALPLSHAPTTAGHSTARS